MASPPSSALPAYKVSPMGASRFEHPFVPASADNAMTPATSPASPTSDHKPSDLFRRTSHASTDRGTTTTAATSVFSHEVEPAEPSMACPISAFEEDSEVEAWFGQFRSDDDLAVDPSDEYPDRATLAAVKDVPIYNAEGESCAFGSLYDPKTSTHQRQLFIFVRHFYCGACQAYLKALTEGITMREYFRIPTPTAIIVIAHGAPDLIPHYRKFSGCPYPIFADPTRTLYKKLGMGGTMKFGGARPEYMKDISVRAWLNGQVKTIHKSLRDPDGIRKRDVFRGGSVPQIGGEFLFDAGEVVWCHRMRHMRDHAEIATLRKVLELDP